MSREEKNEIRRAVHVNVKRLQTRIQLRLNFATVCSSIPFLLTLHDCGVSWVTSYIQSTLVISKSKGLSEILRDIRTSTYQICRIEEKIIGTTTFSKYICNRTLERRDILKIFWKRGEIAPKVQFLLFSTIFFTCC